MILMILPLTVFADNSGSCGDNVKWYYDETNSKLTIEGNGSISDFYITGSPWRNYSDYITTVEIKNGVTKIGEGAFINLKRLTNLIIPNSVGSIESRAFQDCSSLETVTIPGSVYSIGYSAFLNCSKLSILNIAEGLNMIDYAAFAGCRNLSNLVLPSSLKYLGSYAFEGCIILGNVFCYAETPPQIVGMHGDVVFIYSPFDSEIKWASLYVPEGSIDKYKTAGSWGNFRYYMPLKESDPKPYRDESSSTEDEDNLSWEYSENTKTLTISGNGEMKDYSLDNRSPWEKYKEVIETIIIEEGVTTIGDYAFISLTKLNKLNMPNTLTAIKANAFSECYNLKFVKIPDGVISIGEYAFRDCENLTTIELGNTVTSIDNYAFWGCESLTSLEIPNSVLYIGGGAFERCISLKTLNLGNSVATIGSSAFWLCSSLEKIKIPKSVTSLDEYSFQDCSSLSSIEVEDGNTVYDSRENCNAIIETASNKLICGSKGTIIPNSVLSISFYAFNGLLGLEKITIPNSVSTIGTYSFQDCKNLRTVVLGTGITNIGNDSFWCGNTFKGCNNLKDFYMYSEVLPQTYTDIFDESNVSNATLHVPETAIEAYKTTAPWNYFKSIIPLDNTDPNLTGIVNLSIDRYNNDTYYSIKGIKVDRPTKGLFIINRKKIIKH